MTEPRILAAYEERTTGSEPNSRGLGAGLLPEGAPSLPSLRGLCLESSGLAARNVIALALHVAQQSRALDALLEPPHQLFKGFAIASRDLHPAAPSCPATRPPRECGLYDARTRQRYYDTVFHIG